MTYRINRNDIKYQTGNVGKNRLVDHLGPRIIRTLLYYKKKKTKNNDYGTKNFTFQAQRKRALLALRRRFRIFKRRVGGIVGQFTQRMIITDHSL